MISARVVWRFAGLFVAVFCVLMLPWLHLAEGYMAVFRTLGTLCFAREEGRREVLFQDHPDASVRPTFVRVEIANRQRLAFGSGPVRHLDFDARGLGWRPTALVMALILASPLPWGRRLAALGLGVVVMQLVVMGFLALAIWNDSSEIGLVTMSPFWKALVSGWQSRMMSLFSLAAPVLIWLLVTIRGRDIEGLQKGAFAE